MYNAGAGRDAESIDHIRNSFFDPLVPMAIAGDFNLHHPSWALNHPANHSISAPTNEFAEWIVSNSFAIANSFTVPTRRGRTNQANSIIDLTLFNFAATDFNVFRSWECSEDLSFDSDHNGISWAIHPPEDDYITDEISNTGIRIDPAKKQEWTIALETILVNSPLPEQFVSTTDIDLFADSLLNAFSLASSTIMPRRSSGQPCELQSVTGLLT